MIILIQVILFHSLSFSTYIKPRIIYESKIVYPHIDELFEKFITSVISLSFHD